MKIPEFSPSLWSEGTGCGVVQILNWNFTLQGKHRRIPCIYRYAEGLLFDVLTLLEEDPIRAYIEKYAPLVDSLTDAQQEEVRKNSPYGLCNFRSILVNGVEENCSSSGMSVTPFQDEEEQEKYVRECYAAELEGVSCFQVQRFCLKFEGQDWRDVPVKSLRLTTENTSRFFALEQELLLSDEAPSQAFSFSHPLSGRVYTLTLVKEPGEETLEVNGQNTYIAAARRELVPKLPGNESLSFDNHYSTSYEGSSIIGGAVGILGFVGEDACCFSRIYEAKQETYAFALLGIYHLCDDSETVEYTG